MGGEDVGVCRLSLDPEDGRGVAKGPSDRRAERIDERLVLRRVDLGGWSRLRCQRHRQRASRHARAAPHELRGAAVSAQVAAAQWGEEVVGDGGAHGLEVAQQLAFFGDERRAQVGALGA